MTQLGLPLTAPFVRHSETSKDAARSIRVNAGTYRARVYDYLISCGICGSAGATDEQMQQGIPMAASTQRPRRIDLVRDGLVRDSGRKAKTAAGKDAVVWECVR